MRIQACGIMVTIKCVYTVNNDIHIRAELTFTVIIIIIVSIPIIYIRYQGREIAPKRVSDAPCLN